jgi:molecular chaperone DnaJ
VDFGGFGGADFDFEDLFSSFFGGSTRRSRKKQPQKGSNINAALELDFETAIRGGKVPFKINRQAQCTDCNGTGSKDKKQKTCPQCSGAGVVQDIHGAFAMNKTCRTCGGRGRIIDNPCSTCNGRGSVYKSQTIEVNIPRGISDKQVIRLANLGNAGEQGAPAGDLHIEVNVQKHNLFRREGKDIYSDIEVDMVDAALGTKIDVQTFEGIVTLTVPPGTQSGTKMRIRDRGVATRTGKGNHYVIVKVKTPTKLSSKQREILEKFRREK